MASEDDEEFDQAMAAAFSENAKGPNSIASQMAAANAAPVPSPPMARRLPLRLQWPKLRLNR